MDLGWDGSVQLVLGFGFGRPPGVDYDLLVLTDFVPSATLPSLGSAVSRLGLQDFNGDGHPDLYAWGDQGTGFVTFLNNPDGTLTPGPMEWCAGIPQLQFRDFNDNGAMDVVNAYNSECVNNNSGVGVILDDGRVTRLQRDTTAEMDWRVSIVDDNRDGVLDVLTVNLNAGGQRNTFINDGQGNFTLAPVANNDRFVYRLTQDGRSDNAAVSIRFTD